MESRLRPSPRTVFAQQFAALFAAAGNPTLRRVATAAEARMRADSGKYRPAGRSDRRAPRPVPTDTSWRARATTGPSRSGMSAIRLIPRLSAIFCKRAGWHPVVGSGPTARRGSYLRCHPWGADSAVWRDHMSQLPYAPPCG